MEPAEGFQVLEEVMLGEHVGQGHGLVVAHLRDNDDAPHLFHLEGRKRRLSTASHKAREREKEGASEIGWVEEQTWSLSGGETPYM